MTVLRGIMSAILKNQAFLWREPNTVTRTGYSGLVGAERR